ncbi:hypothetical protein ACJX0J_023050 [Zea mays]
MLSCSNYAHVLLLQRHMEALQKVYMLGKQEQIGILCFSKVQIQEKEKELKRDYRMCMIQADPPIWDNIIKVSLLPCFCKLEIFIVCCHFLIYCAVTIILQTTIFMCLEGQSIVCTNLFLNAEIKCLPQETIVQETIVVGQFLQDFTMLLQLLFNYLCLQGLTLTLQLSADCDWANSGGCLANLTVRCTL